MTADKIIEAARNHNCPVLLFDEQEETAKKIVGLLAETGLPMIMADEVLSFCKHAIKFSVIPRSNL